MLHPWDSGIVCVSQYLCGGGGGGGNPVKGRNKNSDVLGRVCSTLIVSLAHPKPIKQSSFHNHTHSWFKYLGRGFNCYSHALVPGVWFTVLLEEQLFAPSHTNSPDLVQFYTFV